LQVRFVGTTFEIWDSLETYKVRIPVFTRFGQLAELPDDLAQRLLDEGAPFLKASDFDQRNFTVDELKKFSTVASHGKAPAEFIVKRDAAWKQFQTKSATPKTAEITGGVKIVPAAVVEPKITNTDQSTKK
jgi:hypothetical protein